MIRRIAALLVAASLAWPVAAHADGMDITATLRFDPARPVAATGGTLGALLTDVTGADAQQGTSVVRLRIRYDPATAVGAANAAIAGFPNAITGASLTLGGRILALDIPHVQSNAGSSKIGLVARPDGFFCNDAEHCAIVGERNAPFGMQGAVMDDAAVRVVDETGESYLLDDAFGFGMGRTDATGEFAPTMRTQGFGDVSADGLVVMIFSRPGGRLLSGLNLPRMAMLEGTTEIARTEVWLYLEGASLDGIVKVEGTIDAIQQLP